MQVNVRQIMGPWDLGYSLDKHTLSSTYLGEDEHGHKQFDTKRSEVGEVLFQLKYRSDKSQIEPLAKQLVALSRSRFPAVGFVVPMPPSKQRTFQPVVALARQVARLMAIPIADSLLVKAAASQQIKDIPLEQRIATLAGLFGVNDTLRAGTHDILLLDDLYQTGSTLVAATTALRAYPKIRKIFVATVTRKGP